MGKLNAGLAAWIKANPKKAIANKAKFFTSKKTKMINGATSPDATGGKKKSKKFIQKVVGAKGFRKGTLRRKMGVKGKNKISVMMLDKKIAMLKKKSAKGKLTAEELRTMREMIFARNIRKG